jgi:hypothetical protein
VGGDNPLSINWSWLALWVAILTIAVLASYWPQALALSAVTAGGVIQDSMKWLYEHRIEFMLLWIIILLTQISHSLRPKE